MERFPGAGLFILSQNPGVSRPAKGTHPGYTFFKAGDVSGYQIEGPSDGNIGSSPGGHERRPVIYVQLLDDWPVDHDKRLDATGTAQVLKAICRVGKCLNGGNQYWHVLGAAAGHHPVNRNIPRGSHEVSLRQNPDFGVRGKLCPGQHLLHFFCCRRYYGKTIRPALIVEMVVDFIKSTLTYNIFHIFVSLPNSLW